MSTTSVVLDAFEDAPMPWWGWTMMGTLLFGAELLGVSAQFYLVFVGAAAIVVGLIGVIGIALPAWVQWITFAALALVFMFAFRERLYRRFRETEEFVEGPLTLGDPIIVPQRLESGASCRVEYRGTSWTARNVDTRAIESGVEAEICHTAGLTLHVRNRAGV